jgi:hypothetical protein
MKLSIYFDVESWMSRPEHFHPFTKPSTNKSKTAKRYRIDVEIEDPKQPDVIVESEAIEEINNNKTHATKEPGA